MKLLTVFTISIISCAFAASEGPKRLRTTSRTTAELRAAVEAAGGCNVNVCFALDGSGSVTSEEYDAQRFFVGIFSFFLFDGSNEVAAVQYGLVSYPISFLTPDGGEFFPSLLEADFRNSPRTNIGGGIVWCHNQIRKRPGEVNKIVVISDGRNNLGGDPVTRANLVREKDDGKVCVIGIGDPLEPDVLLGIAGGNQDLFLRVDAFRELFDILEDSVEQICEVTLPS